jgi:type I restriction enzyme S subunit
MSTVGEQFEVQLGKMLDAAKNVGDAKPYLGNRAVQWDRIELSAVGVVPLTKADMRRFRLRNGDLLVCEGGEVGRGAIWRDELPECYYQKALHRLRPKKGYNIRMMLALLEYWSSIGAFTNYVTQTSIAHLPRDKFIQMPLPLPADGEQHQISEVLQDIEDLIVTLERLIVKKQAIKQGMMQQLLAGGARLPGFEGAWKEFRLENVCTRIQDGTHFSPRLGGSDYNYVTSRNIGVGELKLDDVATISASEHRKIYQRCDTRYGDLLLTKDGANTGNVAINTYREEISLLSSVAFIRCNHALAQETYILQYLLSHSGRRQIADLMAGNAITRLTLHKIKSLRITLPPAREQSAIAQMLGDADREVAILRTRLTKARSVREGMMQELLTGRTRLPVPEAAS